MSDRTSQLSSEEEEEELLRPVVKLKCHRHRAIKELFAQFLFDRIDDRIN